MCRKKQDRRGWTQGSHWKRGESLGWSSTQTIVERRKQRRSSWPQMSFSIFPYRPGGEDRLQPGTHVPEQARGGCTHQPTPPSPSPSYAKSFAPCTMPPAQHHRLCSIPQHGCWQRRDVGKWVPVHTGHRHTTKLLLFRPRLGTRCASLSHIVIQQKSRGFSLLTWLWLTRTLMARHPEKETESEHGGFWSISPWMTEMPSAPPAWGSKHLPLLAEKPTWHFRAAPRTWGNAVVCKARQEGDRTVPCGHRGRGGTALWATAAASTQPSTRTRSKAHGLATWIWLLNSQGPSSTSMYPTGTSWRVQAASPKLEELRGELSGLPHPSGRQACLELPGHDGEAGCVHEEVDHTMQAFPVWRLWPPPPTTSPTTAPLHPQRGCLQPSPFHRLTRALKGSLSPGQVEDKYQYQTRTSWLRTHPTHTTPPLRAQGLGRRHSW